MTDDDDDDAWDEVRKASDALVKQIRPLLAGYPAPLQGMVVAELAAIWLADHDPMMRANLRKLHDDTIDALLPLWHEHLHRGRQVMTDEGQRSMDAAIEELRDMPPNERCEAIISLFSMVVAEFATMVLEHCEATPISPKAKRAAKKLQRKLKKAHMIAPPLMGDDFRAWLEARLVPLHAWASQTIAQGRQVSPGIIVFRDDNEMALMPVDLDTVAAKNLAAALHRLTASLAFARKGAIFVSEAWIGPRIEDDKELERANREGLEHFPGRGEGVVWSALRGERQLIAVARIDRPCKALMPFEIIDPQRELLSGRMVPERAKGKGH